MSRRDEKDAILAALTDRCIELVSSVLGKPSVKSSRYYRFLGDGQKKSSSPAFILNISGPRMGRFQDFRDGKHGDMLQFISDYVTGDDFKSALSWAKDWLRWDNGASPLPIRPDAAKRRERLEQQARQEAEAAAEEAARINYVRKLWGQCVSIAGTAGEIYLRNRNIFTDNMPMSVRWSPIRQAAAFVVTNKAGEIVALQYVAVTPDGHQDKQRIWTKDSNHHPKHSVGPIGKGAVRFPGDPSKPICYAEGPETGLSVWLATGYETHVLLGASGFRRLPEIAPKDRRIIVLRDDDEVISAAYKSAKAAVSALRKDGFDVREAWPNDKRMSDGSDFNDIPPTQIRRRLSIANHDAPVIKKITGNTDTASNRLNDYVGEFFNIAWRWDGTGKQPAMVVKVKVGGGKTETALRHAVSHIAKLRASGDLRPVLILIPEHRLAEEVAGRAREMAKKSESNIVVDVYRGRSALKPNAIDDDDRMCVQHKLSQEAHSLAVRTEEEICPTCPLFMSGCAYLAQKGRSADIWIASNKFAFRDLPKPINDLAERDADGNIVKSGVAAVIIDESIIQTGLIGVDGHGIVIPIDLLEDPSVPVPKGDNLAGPGTRLQENRSELAKALRPLPDGPIDKYALMAIGFDADTGKAMAALEWQRKIDDGPWHERHDNRTIRTFSRLWHEIENMLSSDGDLCGSLSIERTPEGAKAVRITGRAKVSKSLRTPTLLIDAKADAELIKYYWPHIVETVPIDISAPHQIIRQAIGKSFGKTHLEPEESDDHKKSKDKAKARLKIKSVILREVRRVGGKAAVISNKGVIKAINLPSHIQTLHFNATAGRDHLGDVDLLIIVGRPQPKPYVVERMVGALTGSPVTTSLGRGWYDKADAVRRINTVDGETGIPTIVDRHPDDTAERLRSLICSGEIEQAIGRARGVRRTKDNPVEIIVLTDVVLDVAVDELLPDSWLNPSLDDKQLAAGGIAFADGTPMAAVYPDIFPSAAAARQRKGREPEQSVTFTYENTYTGLSRCGFQKAGERAKRYSAVFDPAMLPNPRPVIEAAMGPLAWLAIEGDEQAVAVPMGVPMAVGAEAVPLPAMHESTAPHAEPEPQPSEEWISEIVPEPPELAAESFGLQRTEIGTGSGQRYWAYLPQDAIIIPSDVETTGANDDSFMLPTSEPQRPRAKKQAKRQTELTGADMGWLWPLLSDSGITKSEFARQAGMSPSHLRNIETGHRQPTPEQLDAIQSAADKLTQLQRRLL